MKCAKKYMRLYAVTDSAWIGTSTLFNQVQAALEGGVTCVQLREKNLSQEEFLKEAWLIKDICREYAVPFIINDDVEIAVRCGADGVHVGQHDIEASQAREIMPDSMILGISVRTVEQALVAQKKGADYLGVGAAFATSTKLDADHVSLETIKSICEAVDIPVVAIGGINKDNIAKLSGTGVDGVALVSAIFASDDIEDECRRLLALSQKMVLGVDCIKK